MTIPMILLTLVLNGTEVSLHAPIITAVDDHGARQIMVPLRETFEAAGFVVQYHDGDTPRVEITAHVDRLPARRHLVRHGTAFPGRSEIRAHEYVAALPLPVERIEGTLYAPSIVLRIIGGGDLRIDLDESKLHWDLHAPEQPPVLAVAELLSELPVWFHRRVRCNGTFHGPDAPAALATGTVGAPAPGAWAVSDDTAAIYCTDAIQAGGLHVVRPRLDSGQQVAVEGIVRPGWGGLPYLSAAEIILPDDE